MSLHIVLPTVCCLETYAVTLFKYVVLVRAFRFIEYLRHVAAKSIPQCVH